MAFKKRKNLQFEDLQPCFELTLRKASEKLDLSVNGLKKTCRRVGIGHWPYRTIQRLHSEQAALETSMNREGVSASLRQRKQEQAQALQIEIDALLHGRAAIEATTDAETATSESAPSLPSTPEPQSSNSDCSGPRGLQAVSPDLEGQEGATSAADESQELPQPHFPHVSDVRVSDDLPVPVSVSAEPMNFPSQPLVELYGRLAPSPFLAPPLPMATAAPPMGMYPPFGAPIRVFYYPVVAQMPPPPFEPATLPTYPFRFPHPQMFPPPGPGLPYL